MQQVRVLLTVMLLLNVKCGEIIGLRWDLKSHNERSYVLSYWPQYSGTCFQICNIMYLDQHNVNVYGDMQLQSYTNCLTSDISICCSFD